jgi:ABC-type transporter MlaC component
MVQSKKKAVLTRFAGFVLFMATIMTALQLGAAPAQAGQASLSWSAPTTNTDGTPVSNLAGYNIYIGNASRSYQQKINAGLVSSYAVTNLADGATYYFAVTAYNSAGMESPYSVEGTKTFPALPTTYTITATAGAGGTITALNNSRVSSATSGGTTIQSVTVTQGASQSFSIAANTGYRIADVRVNGVSVGAVTSYSFTNVTANRSIAASFTAATTTTPTTGTVAFATTSGGSGFTDAAGVTYRADAYYSGGAAATTAVAISNTSDDALYQSERWGASSYNIPLANGSYNLTLKFAETFWSAAGLRVFDVVVGGTTMVSNLDIFAKAGKNAAYDVVLPVTVTNGTLNIRFVNKVDNAKICAIKVTTATTAATPQSYSITASAGGGGTIAPAGTATVTSGSSKSYSITPATGYRISDVKVDGVSVGAVASYSFTNVTANRSIAATFALKTYSITASAGTGGSITPSGSATVSHGGSASYSIAAATGYSIADVKVDGVSVGAVASYSFTNVTANRSIQASFAPKTYSITASAGTGGSITPSGTATVSHGGSASYSIAAATGYRIADVKVDGVSVGALASYSFTNVTANRSIAASFAATVVPGTVVYAASSGGTQYTDAAGVTYRADAYFSGGNAGTMGVAINNTTDDLLYQTERWGASTYNIPLPNGNYNLTLKFAETYWSAAGRRVFDVAVGGTTMVSNLDIYARAGKNNAYDLVLPVTVTNGTLNIRFLNKVDNAKICAIKVATR